MSIINKILFQSLILVFFSFKFVLAEDPKVIGKFKDWKAIKISDENNKVCFAQSNPVLQSPKKMIGKQDYLLHLDQMKKYQMK